jgi:pyrimidine-specific ribonucleoside hydrolase
MKKFRLHTAVVSARLILALLFVSAASPTRAHNGPSVIVDTDMAADDARALALLLNCPYVNVVAVVTSDGASPPDVGLTNVCRMLGFLKLTGVAVGMGRPLDAPAPAFRANATELDWAQLGEPMIPPGGILDAAVLVRLAAETNPSNLVYVCLGPLTNLKDALERRPELVKMISRVLWYGTPPSDARPSWNATRDDTALKKVAATGLTVAAIHWPEDAAAPVLDDALLDEIAQLDSPAAELVVRLHSSGRGAELVRAKHLRMWDDLVALRFLDGTLGMLSPLAGRPQWTELTGADAVSARRAFLEKLRLFPPRGTVVMAHFPTNATQLLPDLRENAVQIVSRHGVEEWKAAVLTSELHRHLGTYSIVGAKMGLRARELFNAALDELRVESHAGLKPPLSCVNDGLQVATGASLGRGTIAVVTNSPAVCEAVFHYGEGWLKLRLKPELAKQIAADMTELEKRHGGMTPEYFQAVRGVSLKHWLSLDRTTMFEETMGRLRVKP